MIMSPRPTIDIRRRLPLVVVIVAVLALGVAPAAGSEPGGRELTSAQERATAVRAEVAALDVRVATAVERYNIARLELDQTNALLQESRRELARAQQQLGLAEASLAARMTGMYKSPQLGLLDVVLAASDVSDIETQMAYFEQVSSADSAAVAQLGTLTAHVSRVNEEIEGQRGLALGREMDLRDRQAQVEDELASRKALLSDLDARVKQLIEREERRRAAAARRLAEKTGVDITRINGSAAQIAVVRETMKYLGIPYVWGGASPSQGFDCSGLVLYVYRKFGVEFLHGATVQARQGTPVPLDLLQPADLVFFGDPSFYRHVGIYIGDGLFIEAPRTGDVIKVSKLEGRGCALACRYPIRVP
jgi:cell wall-associated NlpC family hydrolase